jgi:hypothetical protein
MNIPSIGSVVQVTTRRPEIFYFSSDKYFFNTIKGTVLKQEKWMSPGQFPVATGNPDFPVSVIDAKNIHKLDLLTGTAKEITTQSTDRIFKVHSKFTQKDYIVTVKGAKLHCTCVGFEYRKHCKHSDAVAKRIGLR